MRRRNRRNSRERKMKKQIWLKYKNQHNALTKDHYSRFNKSNW